MITIGVVLVVALLVIALQLHSIVASLRTTNEMLHAFAQRPVDTQKVEAPTIEPARRRVIAIHNYGEKDDRFFMADADDGTNWVWDDKDGWLLASLKCSIPQQATMTAAQLRERGEQLAEFGKDMHRIFEEDRRRRAPGDASPDPGDKKAI